MQRIRRPTIPSPNHDMSCGIVNSQAGERARSLLSPPPISEKRLPLPDRCTDVAPSKQAGKMPENRVGIPVGIVVCCVNADCVAQALHLESCIDNEPLGTTHSQVRVTERDPHG